MSLIEKALIVSEDLAIKAYYGPSVVASSLSKTLSGCNFKITHRSILISRAPNYHYLIINRLRSLTAFVFSLNDFKRDCKQNDLIIFLYLINIDCLIFSLIATINKKKQVLFIFFPPGKRFLWLINRYISFFIAMNPYIAEYLITMGLPSEKIKIIEPSIDVNNFKHKDRNMLQKKYKIPQDKFVALYHGRMSASRGIILFIDALRIFSQECSNLFVVLSLATEEEDLSFNFIYDYIYKCDMVDKFKIIYGLNDASEIYNLANVVVFPFLINSAISPPLSILEAMATETIVIASDIEESGTKHIIRNGSNGFLIKPNEDDLLKTLRQIKSMRSEEMETLAKNARNYVVQNCSSKIICNKFYKLIEELC